MRHTKSKILILAISFTLIVSHISSNCTPGACYACDTDGSKTWCTACGNGYAISGEPKNTSCSLKITVPNCRSAPENDSSNPNICGVC